MRSFFLGFVLALSFVVGASCARPPAQATAGPSPRLASALRGDDLAMTCTVEDASPDELDVAIVCTVPRDLSVQVRAILEGRAGAAPASSVPPSAPSTAPSKVRR